MTQEKKKILIVDDEVDLLEILGTFFQSKGFEVLTAPDGVEAQKIIDDEAHLDVVIADVKMPRAGGIEVLKKVVEKLPGVPPVIFISGYAETSAVEAFSLGAEELLAKPFPREMVFESVQRVLTPYEMRWDSVLEDPDLVSGFDCVVKKEEWEKSKDRYLGRGGVFIPLEGDFPSSFEVCKFSIKLEGKADSVFCGHGVVRWVRREVKRDLATGIGLEVQGLSKDSKKMFINYLTKNAVVSFIPRGTVG